MNLQEFRGKYPQYNDMSDQELSDALYNKYYSDMGREQFDEHFHAAATDTPDQEEFGWFERVFAGPVIRGANQLQTAEAVMGGAVGWKNQEETAEAIADAQRDIAAAPTSEAAQQGLQEITETTRATTTAGAWGEAAVDLLTNLPAVWDVTVSSLVSSIPALAGFTGGLFGGGLLAGPPGAVVGAMGGTAAGSFAIEYSNSLVDAMNQAGVNTQDGEEILAFLQDDAQMAKAREFARTRGINIALFDAVTAGVAGRLFKPTAKIIAGVEGAQLASQAGVRAADVARRGALARGNMTVKQVERAASEAALRATGAALSRSSRAAGATVELAAQMTGGAAGEAAAQFATEGEVSGPGEVLMEAIAEGPIGGIQALIASQRPRVAPDPLDPSVLPEAPTPIAREAYDAPLDGDPIAFVETQAANFIDDTPTTMVNGAPSTEPEDYNVVPFSGKDAEGTAFSGWRVETKAGVPITPVIDSEVRAEGAREAFVDGLSDVIDTQEQLEINRRADDALGPDLRADENPELFAAAQEIDKDTILNLGDQTPSNQKKVIAWREKSRQSKEQEERDMVPVIPEGKVAVEEMSLAGVRNDSITLALEKADHVAIGETEDLATVRSLQLLTAKRNINTEDDAFWNAVRRVTGFKGKGKDAAEKFKNMSARQRQALKEKLEKFKSSLPGEGRQSLPVTKRKPFTGAQYNTVIAAVRRQRARDRYWQVETKDGTQVPRSGRFGTRQKAAAFKAGLKDKGKGTRVKEYKETNPLREGEIQKSDIAALLGRGRKVKNTDAILDAAVERGDLIKSRGQRNRWRLAEYEIRETQPLAPGLQKRLAARLRGSGIPTDKISLKLAESLEDIGPDVAGVYVDRVIKIAMNKLPENATMEEAKEILGGIVDHEVIHALFELGLFSNEEKASLYRFTAGTVVPKESGWYNPDHPKQTYFSRAERVYKGNPQYQEKDKDGNTVPNVDKIAEEGVAEAFKDFASNVLIPAGKPRSLLNRIITFFRGLTTVSPQDARYFAHKFTPIKEGRGEGPRRRRKVVAGQADVDVPVEERGPRYSLADEELDGQQPDGDHPSRISTRFPAVVDPEEDVLTENLRIDAEAMKRKPPAFAHNVRLLKRIVPNSYWGFRAKVRNAEKVAEEFIAHVTDNLLWLYDQVPEDVRERSKLWYSGARSLVTTLATEFNVPDRSVAAVFASLSPQKDWYQNASLAERVMDTYTMFTSGRRRAFIPDDAMKEKARQLFQKLPVKMIDDIMSRSFRDITNLRHKAIWLRAYDEVHNPRGFRTLTPEGTWIGAVSGKVGWGSLTEIAKAISALEDSSRENINEVLGKRHKIRNFYNNILAPDSPHGDITIDTHAVAAGLVAPLSGSSIEVFHNFGMAPLKKNYPKGWRATQSVGASGAFGTYGLYADAYRRAAEARGIHPREMQSVTWEAIRGIFSPQYKGQKKNRNKIAGIWRKHESGAITKQEAREEILAEVNGIKNPDWFDARDTRDEGTRRSSYDGELAKLRLRRRRPTREPDAGTGRAARGVEGRGPRYSLAEDRMLDTLEYRERQRQRQRGDYKVAAADVSGLQAEERNAAKQSILEKRGIFTGFSDVDDNAFVPVKMFNGGVTNVPIDGKFYPVVMTIGHDQWSTAKNKYVGWGMKHSAHHLDDIVQNTNYNSVDAFVSGMLNMYHANRVLGPKALKEANFEVFEVDSWTDDIRGPKTVIRWWYNQWAVPGTLVLQKIDFSAEEKTNPKLRGNSFASLVTAYALPSIKGQLEPRKSQIINPAASLTAKKAAYTAKPRESINKKLAERYSLSDKEGLTKEYKSLWDRVFGAGKQERRSFGQYLFGPRSPSKDIEKFGKPSLFRWHAVDRWEGVTTTEMALRKEMPDLYNDIYADSSAGAMFAMLGRAAGLMQQLLIAGPVIYTRGFFHAINENIVNAAPSDVRVLLRNELDQLKDRAGYRREDGSSHEVKGLMQIFYPLYNIGKMGGLHAWSLYAAARRAKRLKTPTAEHPKGREFLMSNKDIEVGLKIAEDPLYMDAEGNSLITQVYEDYQRFNNALVMMMVNANLISEEAGKTWIDNADYLPFYRELFVEDTTGGGLNGQVVFNDPGAITDQDAVSLEATIEGPAAANNNFFQNLYNVPAPRELKGGKRTYFIMVNGVRDAAVYSSNKADTAQGRALYDKLDELRALNPDIAPANIKVHVGTQRIQDPLENILRNANAAITASMRNVGMLRAIRDLGRRNMAWKMKVKGEEQPKPKWDQIGVRVNGETAWYNTSDPLLFNSIQSTGDLQIPGMGIMSTPANILRELVTKTPDFMLANMLRDTISAWATSGANIWPVTGTTIGFAQALGGSGSTAALRAAGVFGGYDFKNDPRDAKKALEQYMRRGVAGAGSAKDYLTKGWVPSLKSPLAPVTKLWQFADDITVATDMGTRIAVYNSVLAETGNEAQAAYEALEVINFSRKGSNKMLLYLTAVIPFLNARIQGLDVLWRGSPLSRGGVTGYNVEQRNRRFIWRMATLVALSSLYALAHSDDPEDDPHYANATQEKKDMYWIFRPEWLGLDPKTIWVPKIPIAFEVGLLTKTLPERIIRLINGTDDGRTFAKAMQRGVVGTLNMNPIPQYARPLFEAAFNRRMYDWSEIVPPYSEKDAPDLARPGTSDFAIEVAKQTGISAELIEHVINQYTGTLGMYALMGVDVIANKVAGNPSAPSLNVTQYPFLQRFMQSDLGGGDAQEFYALRSALDEVVVNMAKRDPEAAAEVRADNWALLSRKGRIDYLDQEVSRLRNQEQEIRAAKDVIISPERKRALIREIREIRSEVLSNVRTLSREARQ
jgi:hypothetical protein